MNDSIPTSEDQTVKSCRKCGASDWYKSGKCKPCHKERGQRHRESNREVLAAKAREYRKANPEKVIQSERKRRELHKDKLIKYQREYRKANPEKAAESVKKWLMKNPDKVSDNRRKYHQANREKILEYQRKRYKENGEKQREQSRNWAKSNPDKRKVQRQNRRAIKKANGGRLSPNIVKKLIELQKNKCVCCGDTLSKGYHLDHIMPLVLGGTNTDDNVQLLTPSCNMRKSSKHPDVWAQELGRLL